MKYTYLMEPQKVKAELERLWQRYQEIINKESSGWEEMNEARAILFLTGQVYCEKIAVEAIERRLHLLPVKLSSLDFLTIVDQKLEKPEELKNNALFSKLEEYYIIIRDYKNRHVGGKYYLEEEKFIEQYKRVNPDKDLDMGHKGSFE